jgi:transcriptional regulator with XRE-family HTH domain
MLDARIIGSRISKHRKDKDLTQVELANQLNVSHQAVSKWERGESIPDLATLIHLADKFNTTIDNLFKGNLTDSSRKPIHSFVTHIVDKKPEEAAKLVNSGHSDIDQLVEMAPLLKSSELRSITVDVDSVHFDFDHLVGLSPFLDSETLDPLAKQTDFSGKSYRDVSSLAPFVSKRTLLELIEEIEEDSLRFDDVIRLAPFLNESVEQLLQKHPVKALNWSEIEAIAPFIGKDALLRLIEDSEAGKPGLNHLLRLAPFLREDLDRFVNDLDIDKISWETLSELAPFMKRDTLSNLVSRINAADPDMDEIIALAPFLEKDTFEELVLKKAEDSIGPEFLSEAAPFLKKETVKQLAERMIRNNH